LGRAGKLEGRLWVQKGFPGYGKERPGVLKIHTLFVYPRGGVPRECGKSQASIRVLNILLMSSRSGGKKSRGKNLHRAEKGAILRKNYWTGGHFKAGQQPGPPTVRKKEKKVKRTTAPHPAAPPGGGFDPSERKSGKMQKKKAPNVLGGRLGLSRKVNVGE